MSNRRFPVGGVDRNGKIDRISIQNAVETPFWMAIWATEPERMIDVRMSYSDLKVICDLIDKEKERMEAIRNGQGFINRESLIENLKKFAPEHYNALINDLILKEPTAFDKEKVMSELQNAADLNIEDGWWHIELQEALGIVERGGING